MPELLPTHFFRTLLLIGFLAFWQDAAAQYWARKGGSLTVDEAYDVAVDANGNTYSTGYYTGTATFGSTTFVSEGGTDIFVMKTNNQGVVQWAATAGSSDADRGLSIAVDANGNCYVTGYFSSTATFDTSSLTSEGVQDVFLAKYNTSGALQWVISAGGTSSDVGNGIALDNSGNPIVTGEFKGSADFGSTSLSSMSNSTDAFIFKATTSGSVSWAKKGSSANTDRGLDVACDNSGNIYAIGQFSGTITFDASHTNTMFNVIYVVKFNNSGSEQWFRIIGAGNSNIANAIASDGSGNIYITGDFTGTVTFFGSTNTNLSNTYDNRIFVAKYNSSGTLTWATSAGSDSDISSRNICIDGSGNAYIVGHFKCVLDEFSDEYGEAIFNSVGYSDVFMAKYNTSGTWQYSRHVAGPEDDYGYGCAIKTTDQMHYAGSFKSQLNIPVSSNFIASNLSSMSNISCNGNANYCGDADYGKFYKLTATGNSDVVVANCFDPDREPYDYYMRSGSGCTRDLIAVHIEPGDPDSVAGCSNVVLDAYSNMCSSSGPDFNSQIEENWQWSNFWTYQNGSTYTNSGYKTVTLTTSDECISSIDSIYVTISSVSPPSISDDVVVQTNSTISYSIKLCAPDTVTLTGGNYGTNQILWTGPGLGSNGSATESITTSQSGYYIFLSIDSVTGCTNSTAVNVSMIELLDSFSLQMNVTDSLSYCEGTGVDIWLYDSVSNAMMNPECFTNCACTVYTTATVTPNEIIGLFCATKISLINPDSGWHTVTAQVVRYNLCDTDTQTISGTFYITQFPSPEVPPFNIQITGSSFYCPGDSTLLTATGGPGYVWSTPNNYNNSTNDSIYANADGVYTVSYSVSDTNEYGCTDSYTSQDQLNVSVKPQPEIESASFLICPNDSVQLLCSYAGGNGGYFWSGPNGPIAGNTNSIFVSEAGQYYCTFNDADSCGLVSNTVTLTQYTTPQLLANGDLVICDGDSVTLSVLANDGSQIEWMPPLSGSGTSKTVYEPGVYSCQITACGIVTTASMEVFPSAVDASITPERVLCIDDTIRLFGASNQEFYEWSPIFSTDSFIQISNEGTYVLMTYDSTGCTKFDTITIEITQEPTVVSLDTIPVFCVGDSIEIFGNENMSKYLWSPTGDSTQSIVVFVPGTYSLTTTDSNGCVGSAKSPVIQNPRTDAPFEIVGDTAFCEGDSVILRGTRKGGLASYLWLSDSVKSREFTVRKSGTYQLICVDTFGCYSASRSISVFMQPNVLDKPWGLDTLICAGTQAHLRASSNAGEISWYEQFNGLAVQSGNVLVTPPLFSTTTYYLYSSQDFCSSDSSAITVTVINCDSAFIPNVLTPNGDGINDVFRIEIAEAKWYRMHIFNRWGQLMFTSQWMKQGWDGTVTNTGEFASPGTYYYLIEYTKFDDETATAKGVVTLIKD